MKYSEENNYKISPLQLTDHWDTYNWITDNDIIRDIILPKITKIFEELGFERPISFQCWTNLLEKGEGIAVHNHFDHRYGGGYGAQITLRANGSGTNYLYPKDNSNFLDEDEFYCFNEDDDCMNVSISHEDGTMTVFPGKLTHHSVPNANKEHRIGIGIQIWPGYDNENINSQYVIK